MHKDSFEQLIGAKLRGASASIPSGAWDAVQRGIDHPGLSNSGISFGGAIVVAVVMLSGLALYNPSPSVAKISPTIETTANLVELIADPSEALATEAIREEASITENTLSKTTAISPSSASTAIASITEDQAQLSEAIISTMPSSPAEAITVQNQSTPPVKLAVSIDQSRVNAEMPQAKIVASTTEGYAPLTVSLSNTGKADINAWEFGHGEKIGNEVQVQFTETGRHRVSLLATNENGKSTQAEVVIVVHEGSSFDIPNSFSPNGDGLNETYGVKRALHIKEFLLVITDETGNKIFQTKDLSQSWSFDPARLSSPDSRLFVSYRAVGEDGVVHAKVMMPLTVIR